MQDYLLLLVIRPGQVGASDHASGPTFAKRNTAVGATRSSFAPAVPAKCTRRSTEEPKVQFDDHIAWTGGLQRSISSPARTRHLRFPIAAAISPACPPAVVTAKRWYDRYAERRSTWGIQTAKCELGPMSYLLRDGMLTSAAELMRPKDTPPGHSRRQPPVLGARHRHDNRPSPP